MAGRKQVVIKKTKPTLQEVYRSSGLNTGKVERLIWVCNPWIDGVAEMKLTGSSFKINSKIPKFQDSRNPRFQDSKFQDSKIPEFQNSKIPNSRNPEFVFRDTADN